MQYKVVYKLSELLLQGSSNVVSHGNRKASF